LSTGKHGKKAIERYGLNLRTITLDLVEKQKGQKGARQKNKHFFLYRSRMSGLMPVL
jgi:hypothetical protein